MGWLRKQLDATALVLAWALLLQAAIVSFASGVEAAALASGDTSIVCTAKGIVPAKSEEKQKRTAHKADCCKAACRTACAGAAGVEPRLASLPLPARDESAVALPTRTPHFQSADHFAARPRGPPTA